jgi:hypothetical protein
VGDFFVYSSSQYCVIAVGPTRDRDLRRQAQAKRITPLVPYCTMTSPADIVVPHSIARTKSGAEARGSPRPELGSFYRRRHLSNFNPMEQLFAKLKALLHTAAAPLAACGGSLSHDGDGSAQRSCGA